MIKPYSERLTESIEAKDKRIAELEAALRPFADAYRTAPATEREYGRGWALWDALNRAIELKDFARASELVP